MRKVKQDAKQRLEHNAFCECVKCTHNSWCDCDKCKKAKQLPYRVCTCSKCKPTDGGFCCMVREYNPDVKEVEECGVVAPYFFNINTKPDREFYMCEDHFDELTNDDSDILIFTPFSREGNRNLYRVKAWEIEGK